MPNGLIKTTALVLTYNQEDCIEEAIRSVVGQTLQPDEILVSDDCSADATYERAQNVVYDLVSAGAFKGTFRLNKNKENLGFIPHFNWAVQECSGEFILYNAGDDTSMPDRLEVFLKAYEQQNSPKYFLGHSSVQIKGGPQDGGIWVPPIEQAKFPIERLANSSALHIGAAQCFTKSLFDDFGPIRFNDAYEDLILGFRALLTDAYWYSPRPLLTYRVGGLTFWQKNTWEKKRQRYEVVLSQRSLDALKHGRPDLVKEIALAYQDYGFSLSPHPDCIDIYSHQDTEESLFDYSVEEHFHRLPHLIKRRPLNQFLENIKSGQYPNKDKTLIFLRAAYFGWEKVLSILDDLDPYDFHICFDLGINLRPVQNLIDTQSSLDRFLSHLKLHENYRIISACPKIQGLLKEWFNRAVISTSLLIDIDGPKEAHSPPSNAENVKVLVLCEDWESADKNELLKEFICVSSVYPQHRINVFIPSAQESEFQAWLRELRLDRLDFLLLNGCAKNQLENFDHVILATTSSLNSEESAYLMNISVQAIAKGISVTRLTPTGGIRITTQQDFDAHRARLYFDQSVQKKVTEITRLMNLFLGRELLFGRLQPL